jgi:uncharacterized membrane protein
MGASRAEQSVEVDATQEACTAAAADFADYPRWSSNVISVDVHETDAEGRGTLVEFFTDAKVKKVRYVLRYDWAAAPGGVSWTFVEGDVKDVSGEYRFEDLGDGRTKVTYALALDPGGFVPGPVKKVLVDNVMKGSVADFKRRVEEA